MTREIHISRDMFDRGGFTPDSKGHRYNFPRVKEDADEEGEHKESEVLKVLQTPFIHFIDQTNKEE